MVFLKEIWVVESNGTARILTGSLEVVVYGVQVWPKTSQNNWHDISQIQIATFCSILCNYICLQS